MAFLLAGYQKVKFNKEYSNEFTYINGNETITLLDNVILYQDTTNTVTTVQRGAPKSRTVTRMFCSFNDLILFLAGTIK